MISLKEKGILLTKAYEDEVEQEANGKYQLSFKYPASDDRWKAISPGALILADDLHGEQEFRVFEVTKRHGYLYVCAEQVANDLNRYSISSISVDRVTGGVVMSNLAESIIRSHPFSFYSDIDSRHTFDEKNVSAMSALADGKHSILGQWGGDLVRDKYHISLLKNGGRDSEALFMYQKNLKTYVETDSIKDLVTRLHLSIKNSDVVTTVDSPLLEVYDGRIYELSIEVSDQDAQTVDQLQEYGRNYFAKNLVDIPNNSLEIAVTDNQEYDVRIFDTVFVHHKVFGKDLRMKITSYKFSPMGRKLKSIGFGKTKANLAQQMSGIAGDVSEKAVSVSESHFEQKLRKEIKNADRVVDKKIEDLKSEVNDGIEQAKAEAELYADSIKQNINTEIDAVNQSMQAQSEEHDRQVADILFKTQSIETLANQAKSDAASAITQALQYKNEAISEASRLDTVERQVTETKLATAKNQAIAEANELVETAKSLLSGQVSSVSTDLDQTKEAIKLLATRATVDALTGRISSAESTLQVQAGEIEQRLTSTQVESAITSKGYQTKSDVDNNITGRGYITSSALQPYALSTTVQNLVRETADSFNRTISRVENKIPTKIGVTNLLGGTSSDWKTIRVTQYNSLIKFYNPQEWALLNIKTGDSVTFSIDVKTTSGKKLRSRISFYEADKHYYSEAFVVNGEGRLSVTGVVPDGITSVQLFVDANLTATTNTGVTDESCRREKLEIGAIATDWSPAPEDLATVTTLHNVSDTVDSHTRTIGAVGTTGSILDNVSRVIQTANGLVQEVSGSGGIKSQVSQLNNSWSIQNLNSSGDILSQANLSSAQFLLEAAKIRLKGKTLADEIQAIDGKFSTLFVADGTFGKLNANIIGARAITGGQIKFDQAFFNNLMANEAYLKQVFAKNAFITSVQAIAISASNVTTGIMRSTNGALDINLDNANITFNQNATINFNSDSNALVRKKGDVTAFVNFADDSISGGVYAGFGVTSHAVGVTTASNSDRGKFAGMRVYRPNDSLDLVRLIGDTLELRHGTEGKYFYFNPPQLRNNVDMLKLAGAVYTLSRIFMHLSANGWAFDHPSFISGVKNEMARNWLQDFANGGLPR